MLLVRLLLVAAFSLIFIIYSAENEIDSAYAQEVKAEFFPQLNDSRLSVETVYTRINESTNMAFLDVNDILVLEGLSGKVQRIVDGQMLDEPLLDMNSYYQDGLLGIATTHNENGSTYVFLYLNEAPKKYGMDIDDEYEARNVNQTLGYNREGDRLYRFELVDNELVHSKLLVDLNLTNQKKLIGDMHHGGEVIIGPDNSVYVIIGDLDGWKYDDDQTKAQNYENGTEPDGRAGILRVTQDGKTVDQGILGDTHPLNLYYAYGIRNSFGMDFDPVTGKLWDTENGPDYGDEINLVEPGFNSGADIVLGGISTEYDKLNNLVDFNGKGKYREPEFSWTVPVAPTAIKFLNSDKYGSEYENDLFVADNNYGFIYHFDLTENRTGLSLDGRLKDKVANMPPELDNSVVFARGFPGITDLQVSPDGYLYVLASGNIFKIVPKS